MLGENVDKDLLTHVLPLHQRAKVAHAESNRSPGSDEVTLSASPKIGGHAGGRTPDLLVANEALSQLSYMPLVDHPGSAPGAFCLQSRRSPE